MMRSSPRCSRRRRALPAGLLLCAATAAAAPSPAAAAGKPFTCEASVLRGQLLTAPAIEPLVANRGAACATTSVGLPNLTTPIAPLSAGVLAAATRSVGPANRSDLQQAIAAASVSDVKVGSLASLGLALPLDQIALPPEATIPPVDISAPAAVLNALPDAVVPIPTVPDSLTLDVQAAVKELLKLPTTDLLALKGATAIAGASCVNGVPATVSTRSAAGLSVLGNAVDVDTAGDRAILDTQTIDPAAILTRLRIPILDALVPLAGNPAVQDGIDQIKAAVAAALKPVSVPIELARVQVTPGTLTRTADALTQSALGVKVSALGTSVVDLTVAEARVGTAGVDCTPPAAPAAAQEPTAVQAPLACTKRRLVLTDVLRKGDRVRITGVADKRFVGRFVTVRFEADGSTAGRALVAPDGTFETTAALPAKRLRSGNRARYQAILAGEKSLNLKLERRMYVDRLTAGDGRVSVAGRVTRPLGSPVQTITLTRRISCTRSEVVARFKPKADGSFDVTVAAPRGTAATVYRLGTKVRKTAANKKLFPTFTLPRGVDLTT